MNIVKLAVCTIFLSLTLHAQSISPPIAEYRGDKVDGMFQIQNTADYSMAVMLVTKSFNVDDHGQVAYRALDKGVNIRMGSSSFVLRAHDSRMIFYKATFPASPTSFSIIASMTKLEALPGVRVSFVFPHMIYVYQKAKLSRTDVDVHLLDGVLRIHNLSQKLGRVEEVQASKLDFGGFPIYPGQTRDLVATGATKATIKFEDGFKIEIQ